MDTTMFPTNLALTIPFLYCSTSEFAFTLDLLQLSLYLFDLMNCSSLSHMHTRSSSRSMSSYTVPGMIGIPRRSWEASREKSVCVSIFDDVQTTSECAATKSR